MIEKERKRKKMSAAARERRKKHRKRVVMAERAAIAIFLLIVVAGGALAVWHFLPKVKIAQRLEAAGTYAQEEDYEEAIASCEEALKIDSQSVEAYKAMAGIYLTQEDWKSAEQVLYRGWETTQNEGLLQEYCVHLLNDAVSDINGQNCTLQTLEKCVTVMETNLANKDVIPLEALEEGYKLFAVCYRHLFKAEERAMFCGEENEGVCAFDMYLDLMNRMLTLYDANPTDALKAEIIRFAVPDNEQLLLEVRHLADYRNLLARVAESGDDGAVTQLAACLEKAAWVQDTFAQAFDIFESGQFEPIKEFMQSDTYVGIRDQFIQGTMEYWEGKTYIPISREKIKLTQVNGQWRFSFADFDENPETDGVIKVWGVKQEDDGVQRICISYEPASADGEYYPHTTYEFVYLYSNVKIGGKYVPQMNYRFETREATPEGTTSQLIGDWGGEHEWITEY